MSALPPSFSIPAPLASSGAAAARWHLDRPGQLWIAVERVRRESPAAQPWAGRFLQRLPLRPLASQNLRTWCPAPYSSAMPLTEAATCPWIALDGEGHRNCLAFDIDHTDGMELVEALPPSIRPWLVIDPWSGRAHAFVFLASPVLAGEGSSSKARRLAQAAQAMLAHALRATPLGHRALVKNPTGRVGALVGQQRRRTRTPGTPPLWDAWQAAETGLIWHTIPGAEPVELRDIIAELAEDYGDAAAEAPAHRRFQKRRPDPSALGRNCSLFDQVRWWAYDHVERDGGAILAEAERVNATFATPLPVSEVTATAHSIARFMASRFRPRHGASSTRGRDREAGAKLATLGERQALAGRATAAGRAAATDAKIDAALARLRAARQCATQAAIAAAAGVSLRTIKARWNAIRERDWKRVQDAVVSGSGSTSAE